MKVPYLIPILIWEDMARVSSLNTGAIQQDINIMAVFKYIGNYFFN